MTAPAISHPLPAGSTWEVDPAHTTVTATVRHLGLSKVRVNFLTFGGTITIAEDGTPSVTSQVDVTSIDSRNEQRDGHLKSGDFFDAEHNPTATFVSTGVRAGKGENEYLVDGEFTIRGVKKAATLELEFLGVSAGMGAGEVAAFEASVNLNRKDFGVSFDGALADGSAVVSDKVVLTFEIEAVKQ
ncbi:YceI family protein [Jongsikchunia kroppenstedtii]|uniref:YceI family protein n=1 Tax=Jongsikchunia kroppenstedtii TaxID=1121721 RepID=UPI0003687989|nr:YceI family protein [Jongsikchunia kroppenstedtii]